MTVSLNRTVLDAAVRAGGIAQLLRTLILDPFGNGAWARLEAAHRSLSEPSHRPVVNLGELAFLEREVNTLRALFGSREGHRVSLELLDGIARALTRERHAYEASLTTDRQTEAPGRSAGCIVPLKAPVALQADFATLWRLQVVATPGVGDIEPFKRIGRFAGASAVTALHRGCLAARDVMMAELEHDPDQLNRVKRLDLGGEFVRLSEPVDGASLGLAAALATYAAITGLQIQDDVAATGQVDLSGTVGSIGSLREKHEACLNGGISRLFVWKGARAAYELDERVCRLEEVESVGDAIHRLWPGRTPTILVTEQWARAGAAAPAESPSPWNGATEYVMVLTCIQASDPVGFVSVRYRRAGVEETAEAAEAGCALTLHAECRPEMMVCIYTENMRSKFIETHSVLTPPDVLLEADEARQSIRPFAISIEDLPDPSHPQAVMDAFRPLVAEAIAEGKRRASAVGKPLRVVASVSSGTPQMQYAIMRLSLQFQDVLWTLVQVRRTSDIEDDGRRIRIVGVPREIA